jgi:hypothetical protein
VGNASEIKLCFAVTKQPLGSPSGTNCSASQVSAIRQHNSLRFSQAGYTFTELCQGKLAECQAMLVMEKLREGTASIVRMAGSLNHG